jgi:pimeloyl-ACP methyl ester carboxylesterase
MDQRLNSIQVPTLIMAGEKDVLVSKRSLRQLNEGIPNSRLQRLRQCGHLAFVTHPEVVANQTREFLLN